MLEDSTFKMALSDWYPYVEDADTPDESLSWEVSDGFHYNAAIENDTLRILPDANFYGTDTLIVIVSDGQLTDTGSVIIKIAPVNDPPNEFSLLTPEDGYWTNYDPDSSELFFSWTHAKDIDEDSINYKLTIYTDLYGSDTFTVPNTSVLIDYTTLSCIESNIGIYWTVTAFDLKDSTIASNAPFGFSLLSPEALSDSDHLIPIEYCLYPNYPNPFNPETTIKYGLPEESFVTISIYDINGRLMETLIRENRTAGYHTISWRAADLVSGVYFYRIVVKNPARGGVVNFQQVRKCLLVK